MRWKGIAGIGLIIAIAALVTVYVVLTTYDYNQLKPRVARMVKDATGRELRLDGEMDLSLGLSPSLVVEDVALSNAPWGSKPEMITIEKLQLQVRLLPLLLRDLEVSQIGVSNVRVLLETGSDGRPNWNFLTGQATGGRGALKPKGIAVDRVSIANLDFTFIRHQTKSIKQFQLANLEINRQGTEDELAINLRGDLNGQPVTLEGTIGSIHQLFKKERFPVQLAAKSSSVAVKISGAVDNIHGLTGFDLQLNGSGQNLSEIGPFVGQNLPATDQFALKGRLTGAGKALSLKDAQGNARRGSLRLTVNGTVQEFFKLRGMDLQAGLAGKDLAEFGVIIGEKLPATDQFEIQGRLTGAPDGLALHAAQAHAEREHMRLSLSGVVKDLLALRGMDLQSRLAGKDLTALGAVIGEKLLITDQFEIQGRLTGSTDGLALHAAQARVERGQMRLSLTGAVEDLLTLKGMDLQSRLTGGELAEIGQLVGAEFPALGSFDVQGKLTGSPQALSLNPLTAVIDKSDFNGQATAAFLKRPKFTVRLDSSVIDVTALMAGLEKHEHKPANKEAPKRRFFSDEPLFLDTLGRVDADIVLKATNIHARNARLETGHLALKLADHDFRIDKFEVTYKGTKISGNLHIAHGETPQVATEFLVQNFNLGDFLKETGKSDNVRAIIDIAAHGKSRGNSVRRLMANLDGAIGAVMGEGYLTHYLDMLSEGLSEKVIQFWDPPKDVDQINCAVVQFDIKKGVAASRAFVFDTRAGLIKGEGEINLGNEKIDFLLVPKSKHPELGIRPKLKVSGTVMEPQVGVDKRSLLTSGAEGLSELVVGPVGMLAPFTHMGAGKAHPCDLEDIAQSGADTPAEARPSSP